jgi:flagellum-specific peptidoglycan hydrolase FlgJ
LPPAARPQWQQATALITLGAGGAVTGLSLVPNAPADLTSPASLPVRLAAFERADAPAPGGDGMLRSAIVHVARHFLRLAETRSPAEMEAMIWRYASADGADHGPSCAAFASLTLELGSQLAGQESWVTGGTSYPWPVHSWVDGRVDPNPASPAVVSVLQDARSHGRWRPLGDGYAPKAGDWVLFDGHIEVVTKYHGEVLHTIGGDSGPNLSVNAHEYPGPLSKQGVAGFVDNSLQVPVPAGPGTGAAAPGSAAGQPTGGQGSLSGAADPTPSAARSAGGHGAAGHGAGGHGAGGHGAGGHAAGGHGAAGRGPAGHGPAGHGPAGRDAVQQGELAPQAVPVPREVARPGSAAPSRALPAQGARSKAGAGLGPSTVPPPRTEQTAHVVAEPGRQHQHRLGHMLAGRAGRPARGRRHAGSAKTGTADVPATGLRPAASKHAQRGGAAIPGLFKKVHHHPADTSALAPYHRHHGSANVPEAPTTAAQHAFITEVARGAMATQRKYGVPASVTIAQAIDESGWGQSLLATSDHNLFGIKGTGPAGSDQQPTQEVINGQVVSISASFRVYHDIAQSIEAHAKLLANSSDYAAAMSNRHDPNAFAAALTGVYATDPGYGAKLINLMRHYHLYRYDAAARSGAGTPDGGMSGAAPTPASPAGPSGIPGLAAPGSPARHTSRPAHKRVHHRGQVPHRAPHPPPRPPSWPRRTPLPGQSPDPGGTAAPGHTSAPGHTPGPGYTPGPGHTPVAGNTPVPGHTPVAGHAPPMPGSVPAAGRAPATRASAGPHSGGQAGNPAGPPTTVRTPHPGPALDQAHTAHPDPVANPAPTPSSGRSARPGHLPHPAHPASAPGRQGSAHDLGPAQRRAGQGGPSGYVVAEPGTGQGTGGTSANAAIPGLPQPAVPSQASQARPHRTISRLRPPHGPVTRPANPAASARHPERSPIPGVQASQGATGEPGPGASAPAPASAPGDAIIPGLQHRMPGGHRAQRPHQAAARTATTSSSAPGGSSIPGTPSSLVGPPGTPAASGAVASGAAAHTPAAVPSPAALPGNPPTPRSAPIPGGGAAVSGSPDAVPSGSAAIPGSPGPVPGSPGAIPGSPGPVPGSPGPVPGSPGPVPGSAGAISGRPGAIRPGSAAIPGSASAAGGNHASMNGSPATAPGDHTTMPGRRATGAGTQPTTPGRRAAASGNHTTRPARPTTAPAAGSAAPGGNGPAANGPAANGTAPATTAPAMGAAPSAGAASTRPATHVSAVPAPAPAAQGPAAHGPASSGPASRGAAVQAPAANGPAAQRPASRRPVSTHPAPARAPHPAPATAAAATTAAVAAPATGSSAPATLAVYNAHIPPAVREAFLTSAKMRLVRAEQLYVDVACHTGIRWEILAACDWMQCKARPSHSPVYGEKLGSVNEDGTCYRTRSAALGRCAYDLVELARSVYRLDIATSRELTVRELAKVFAAYRWGGLLRQHNTSAMDFPYSVAGLTADHTHMRWPNIDEPDAPDKPGRRFGQPFGAIPVVLGLNYHALA